MTLCIRPMYFGKPSSIVLAVMMLLPWCLGLALLILHTTGNKGITAP